MIGRCLKPIRSDEIVSIHSHNADGRRMLTWFPLGYQRVPLAFSQNKKAGGT